MATGSKRRPPHYVIEALACLKEAGARRLTLFQFERLLGDRWSRPLIQRTIKAMERRGWIVLVGVTVVVTDDGAEAINGVGGAKPKKFEPTTGMRQRVRSTRMPPGLF